MQLSEKRVNMLRAHDLMQRLADEIRFLRGRLPGRLSYLLRQGAEVSAEQSSRDYDELHTLITARISVLEMRVDRIAAVYGWRRGPYEAFA